MSKFVFEAPAGTTCYTPKGDAHFEDGVFETDDAEMAKFVRNGRTVKVVKYDGADTPKEEEKSEKPETEEKKEEVKEEKAEAPKKRGRRKKVKADPAKTYVEPYSEDENEAKEEKTEDVKEEEKPESIEDEEKKEDNKSA